MESHERLRSMLLESGIEEDDHQPLLESLTALHDRYVDDTVPEPSPELAALLAGAAKVVRAPFGTRRARLLVAGAVALGAVGVGGVAAAATNELPSGAQQFVAEFSERYLPFHLPRPEVAPEADDEAPEPPPVVTTDGDDEPAPSDRPSRPARSPRSKPSPSVVPAPSSPVPSPSTPEEPSSEPESPWPSELLPTPSAEPSSGQGDGSEDPQAAPSEPSGQTPEPTPTEEPEDPSAGPSPTEPDPEPSPTSSPSGDPDATVSTRKVADEPTTSGTSMTPVSSGGTGASATGR